MSDEVTSATTETVKTASDGSVKIAVEKYNELLETIADQKGSISNLTARLDKAVNEPPVVHRTVVNKTAEMVGRHLHGVGRVSLRHRSGSLQVWESLNAGLILGARVSSSRIFHAL
jgi:hypothetical protein